MNRNRAVALKHQPRVFARAGGAALEITPDRCPMIAPVDSLALQRRLGGPADFRKATLEGTAVIAAVRRGVEIKLHHLGKCVRHLGFRYEIAAPELDAIDAKITRRHIEQALTKKVGLE